MRYREKRLLKRERERETERKNICDCSSWYIYRSTRIITPERLSIEVYFQHVKSRTDDFEGDSD